MANTKEVRKQISSIKSTRKITSALEMVAASKIKKTQDLMFGGRPYSEKVKEVIEHIASSSSEYSHPFLKDRKVKKVCFIIVSTDKGLCGGLNINLFKSAITRAATLKKENINSSFAIIGTKGVAFFKSIGGEIVAKTEKLGDKPNPEDLITLTKIVLDLHKNEEVDEVYLCSNKFINTMTQKPEIDQLIPLPPTNQKEEVKK